MGPGGAASPPGDRDRSRRGHDPFRPGPRVVGFREIRPRRWSNSTQAIAIEPGNPAFHNDLATALANLGQSQQAIDEFAAAVKLAPGFLPARLNLAQALQQAGRVDEAVDQCRQVLQIDFNNVAARRLLGKLLSGQARPASP